VATSGSDGTARLWDLQGQQLAIFEGRAAEFSPDGTVLATITGDTVKLWPVETFEQLLGRACAWVRPYLTNNPEVSTEDKRLCDGI
jgi:WD40 repeat protein